MKNLFFGLIAVVAFSVSGFAYPTINQAVINRSVEKFTPILKVSIFVDSSLSIQLDETKYSYRIMTRNTKTSKVNVLYSVVYN
jgi:hypothetical protein